MDNTNQPQQTVVIGVTTEGDPLYETSPLDCQTPNTLWYE